MMQTVVIDPLRRFGEPVVRSVPTGVVAEHFRSGDPLEMIADLFELTCSLVEAALRYESARRNSAATSAAMEWLANERAASPWIYAVSAGLEELTV